MLKSINDYFILNVSLISQIKIEKQSFTLYTVLLTSTSTNDIVIFYKYETESFHKYVCVSAIQGAHPQSIYYQSGIRSLNQNEYQSKHCFLHQESLAQGERHTDELKS